MKNSKLLALVFLLISPFGKAIIKTQVVEIALPVPATISVSSTPSPTLTVDEQIKTLEQKITDLEIHAASDSAKVAVEIVQAIFTMLVIVVSGIWGYWLFIQNRQKYPRAKITHQISHRTITNEKIYLHVIVTVSNIGDILLSLSFLDTRIQWVLPLSEELTDLLNNGTLVPENDMEAKWPLIESKEIIFNDGEYEIEPGESQEIQLDYFIDNEVQTIAVYSYLKNQKKRGKEIGWDSTTLYDIR